MARGADRPPLHNRREEIPEGDDYASHYEYNPRGEVVKGTRRFPEEGSPGVNDFVPGHSFRYFYDALGNRLLAASGGD